MQPIKIVEINLESQERYWQYQKLPVPNPCANSAPRADPGHRTPISGSPLIPPEENSEKLSNLQRRLVEEASVRAELEAAALRAASLLKTEKEKVSSLETELAQLKRQRDSALESARVSEESVAQMQARVEALTLEFGRKQDEVERLEVEARLRRQVEADLNSRQLAMDVLRLENGSQRKIVEDLEGFVARLREELRIAREEKAALEAKDVTSKKNAIDEELRELKIEILRLTNESTGLRERLEKEMAESTGLRSRLVKLETENVELVDLRVRLSKFETEATDSAELRRRLARAEAESADFVGLRARLEAETVESAELRRKLARAEAEISESATLRTRLARLESEAAKSTELRARLARLEAEAAETADLRRRLAGFESETVELEGLRRRLESEVAESTELRRKLARAETEASESSTLRAMLETETIESAGLRTRLARLESESAESIELRRRLARLEAEVSDSAGLRERLEAEVAESKMLRTRLARLEAEINELTELRARLAWFETEVSELQGLRARLARADSEAAESTTLRARLESEAAESSELRRKLAHLKSEASNSASLLLEIEHLREELSILKKGGGARDTGESRDLQLTRRALDEFAGQVARVEARTARQSSEIFLLRAELLRLNRVSPAPPEVERLRRERDELTEFLQASKKNADVLEQKFRVLAASNTAYRDKYKALLSQTQSNFPASQRNPSPKEMDIEIKVLTESFEVKSVTAEAFTRPLRN